MKTTRLPAVAVLAAALASQVWAADGPEVQIVPEPTAPEATVTRVAAGRLVVLAAQPASKWDLRTPGAQLRVFEGGKLAAFVAPVPGTYTVHVTSADDKVRVISLVAGGDPHVPPAPALIVDLKAAISGEPAEVADADGKKVTRAEDLAALSQLYLLMVKECAKPAYGTAKQLNDRFAEARDSMLGGERAADGTITRPARLPLVRKRCGAEVAAVIGTDAETPLTEAMRAALAECYQRLAQAVADASK